MAGTISDTLRNTILGDFDNSPHIRYPEEVTHIFQGKNAFDLHNILYPVDTTWIDRWSNEQQGSCLLIVTVRQTNSVARMRNPNAVRRAAGRRIFLHLHMDGAPPIRTGRAYSSRGAQSWLRMLHTAQGNLR
jgi:hypothetical protein